MLNQKRRDFRLNLQIGDSRGKLIYLEAETTETGSLAYKKGRKHRVAWRTVFW